MATRPSTSAAPIRSDPGGGTMHGSVCRHARTLDAGGAVATRSAATRQ